MGMPVTKNAEHCCGRHHPWPTRRHAIGQGQQGPCGSFTRLAAKAGSVQLLIEQLQQAMTSFPTPPQFAHVDDAELGGRGRAAGIEIQTARLILLDPDRFAAAPARAGLGRSRKRSAWRISRRPSSSRPVKTPARWG
jgi:hypothetical protein